MSSLVFAIFQNPDAANRGGRILRALNDQGVITLYALATLRRETGIRSFVIRDPIPDAEAPAAPSLGLALAGLAVVLGGLPAAAVLTTGAGMVSAVSDLAEAGIGAHLLERIAEEFRTGCGAILAEIEDDNLCTLDAELMMTGARILRSDSTSNPEREIFRHLEAYQALDSAAVPSVKAGAASAARARFDERQRLLRKAAVLEASLRREAKAKVRVLGMQAGKLQGEARLVVENRAARACDALARRVSRLREAILAARLEQPPATTRH